MALLNDFQDTPDPPPPVMSAEEALTSWNVPYTKDTSTGVITVSGDINIMAKSLTALPDLTDVIVLGSFWCSQNKLTSLKGCPRFVSGDFGCSENMLTDLEGAPQHVGENFYCNKNKLKTLSGGPQYVGIDYWCADNLLTTLHGAPKKKFKNDFFCSRNNLWTLEGAPEKAHRFSATENPNLIDLYGAPIEFNELFSDIGCFNIYKPIPENLKKSTRRHEMAANSAVHGGTTRALKAPKIIFRNKAGAS